MVGKNLLLIFYDRVLVAQDTRLIPKQLSQLTLISENFPLIPDDSSIVRDECSLILERRLCHYAFLCAGFGFTRYLPVRR